MKGFQPISEILSKVQSGIYDGEDLIELSPFNICLFAYTMLKLPFSRFSPNQERILETFDNPANRYKELLLTCGRKSGKTTMSAILILNSIYRILTQIDNPQQHFGLMPKERIYFILVGTKREQVQNVSFDYVKSLAKSSPYLRNFISNETADELVFEKNLVVHCQSSSARGGRGLSTYMIVFDEIAHFLDNRGNLSGTEVYYALMPNLKPLAPDSRSVLISSPAGKQGIFWELFRAGEHIHTNQETPEAGEEAWRCVFQHPTWELNPKLQFQCLTCQKDKKTECNLSCPSYELSMDYRGNPEKFEMEYGAMFCDTVDAALNAENVQRCASGRTIDIITEDKKTPRMLSLDPALSGNSYALSMGHQEGNLDVVDLIKYWRGDRDFPVKINIVEDFIEKLYKQFYITHIIIDQYQSASTVQRLQEKGIPIYMVNVTQKYNQMAYEYLINRINMGTFVFPHHREAINELIFLQRKQSGKSVRYEAAIGSQDDISDTFARLVYTLDTESGKKLHVGF